MSVNADVGVIPIQLHQIVVAPHLSICSSPGDWGLAPPNIGLKNRFYEGNKTHGGWDKRPTLDSITCCTRIEIFVGWGQPHPTLDYSAGLQGFLFIRINS